MNLLLLEKKPTGGTVEISGSQFDHLTGILRVSVGDSLRVGVLNGNIGEARVAELSTAGATLEIIHLDLPPPPPLPLTLILALPRPQMIKRILQTVATMGVERLCLIQTSKVEKSFWQSPSMTDEAIRRQLILGLEQGVATQLPEIQLCKRFIPFVEDNLPAIARNTRCLVAHPGDYPVCPTARPNEHHALAIGPEGGFIEKEVDLFCTAGFAPVQLGPRILKVETAIPVLLGKLF